MIDAPWTPGGVPLLRSQTDGAGIRNDCGIQAPRTLRDFANRASRRLPARPARPVARTSLRRAVGASTPLNTNQGQASRLAEVKRLRRKDGLRPTVRGGLAPLAAPYFGWSLRRSTAYAWGGLPPSPFPG